MVVCKFIFHLIERHVYCKLSLKGFVHDNNISRFSAIFSYPLT